MRRAGVICELNPFHNGHKFLLEKIKNEYADEIVCIMSGSFVQRGDIAITDKYARTRAALENGADMVVELPTVYAVSSAQVFAHSGVQLANALGCDMLCFGAENSLRELEEVLDILSSNDTQEEIAARMQSGTYYPKAVSDALAEQHAEILRQPNNILAVEYIRACREFGIQPVAICREGVSHDSGIVNGAYASASKIREMLRKGEACSPYTPMRILKPVFLEDIEMIPVYFIKTEAPDKTADIAGISEGLNNRIYRYAQQYQTLDEIFSAVKTKRYTMTRVRRAVICIFLGITDEMQKRPVPYIRVLGVKSDKTHLIRSKSLPLLVDVKSGYNALDNSAKEIFDIEIKATHAINCARRLEAPLNEFQYGLIKL